MSLFLIGAFTAGSVPASAKSGASPTIQGFIRDGQREVFGLNATKGDVINLTLAWQSPKNDLDLYLADPEGAQVAKSAHVGTNNQSIHATANLSGQYLILIDSYNVISPEIAYILQSTVPLYHFDTLYRIRVDLSGLTPERPTNFTATVFGRTFTRHLSESLIEFVDNGTTFRLLDAVPVSEAERFHTSDVTSWRVISPTTVAVVFHDQLKPRLTFSGLLPDFPSTISTVADGHPQNVTSSTEWSDWVDRGSVILVQRTVEAGAGHRFAMVGINRWTVNSSFEAQVLYYQQWRAVVSIMGVPDPGPGGITFTSAGQTLTLFRPPGTWSDWMDDGSLLSLPAVALGGTEAERWATEQKDFIVRDSGPFLVQYTHQYLLTLVASGVANGPTPLATVTQFGIPRQVPVANQWVDWVDAGSEVKLPGSLDNGRGTMWSASSSSTYKVSGAGLFAASYVPKYRVKMVFMTADGAALPSPTPASVDLLGPNGSAVELTRFDGVWLDEGGWQVLSVTWKGANIALGTPLPFSPSPGGVWTIETQVRDVSLRVEDIARLPVVGAHVQVDYPDGTSFHGVTDGEGYATLPDVYPGTTVIRVEHLGLTTLLAGQYSLFSNRPILVTVPLSTPLAAVLTLSAVLVAVAFFVISLRRRQPP